MSEEKAWANPAPAGMIALAVACFTFFAIFNGKVDLAGGIPILATWLLGGFVVQLTVGIIELKSGSTTGGNVFLFFSAFFMLTTAVELLLTYFSLLYGWHIALDARVDGWAWLVLGIGLTTWTAAYLRAAWSLFILIVALDIAAFLVAFFKLSGSAHLAALGGDFLLIAGIFGLYTGCGIIINSAFGKSIIPMGSIIK